jgi:hypothetical protein
MKNNLKILKIKILRLFKRKKPLPKPVIDKIITKVEKKMVDDFMANEDVKTPKGLILQPKFYKASITRYEPEKKKNTLYKYKDIISFNLRKRIITLNFEDNTVISMVYDMLTIKEMK